jgi:uncharacterized phage protein (TIGR02218 family)
MSTYSGLEASAHGGRPVELFRFVHGSQVWTYSTGPEVEYGGETYAAFAVGRDDMGQAKELHKSALQVLLPRTCELSLLYLAGSPESVVTLTVYRQHIGASDGPIVYWKGRVVSVEWPDQVTASLTCESVFTSLKRPGLRARYQRMCRHALYSEQCGVDKADYAVPGTVSAVDSTHTAVTIPEAAGYDDGYFLGGFLALADGTMRFISAHSGSSITLANPAPVLADLVGLGGYGEDYGQYYGGIGLVIYPGCGRDRTTCNDRFANVLNFGGWPWIPKRNPFDGRSLV